MAEISQSDHSSGEISATYDIRHRHNNPVSFDISLFNHQHLNSSSLLPLEDHSLGLDLDLGLGLGFSMESNDLYDVDDELDGFGCGFMSDCGDEFDVDDGVDDYYGRRFMSVDCGDESVVDNGFESDLENVVGIDLNRVFDEEMGRDGFISGDDLFHVNGFESDSENAVRIDLNRVCDDEIGSDDDMSRVGMCCDSIRVEDEREERDVGEDFGWEEVDGMVEISEAMGMLIGDFGADVDEDLDVSVAMEEDLSIEGVSNLDWEMLMNVHNLDPGVEDEYEMLAGQFAWDEGRNPPASREAVENLIEVVVTEDDIDGDIVPLCAICKDDMVVGEKAKSLPCLHRYHGCCIDPWLRMRNTCPVCRYELPTDDMEYERRRRERGLRR